MVRILVGNDIDDDLRQRRDIRWWAQRLLWFAEDGDILLLPQTPDHEFVSYVTGLTGVDAATLQFVIPPPGRLGCQLLTSDRLLNSACTAQLVEALGGALPSAIVPIWPDPGTAELAAALGASTALPGAPFAAQAGGAVCNSKAVFRSVAAGCGVPVAKGAVCHSPVRAHHWILRLLSAGHPVMMKQEFNCAGAGNELVSPVLDTEARGSEQVVVVEPTDTAVRDYVDRRWEWLSAGGRHSVVVEQFHEHARSLFAEYQVTDRGPQIAGCGEMRYMPGPHSQVVPPSDLAVDDLCRLVTGGQRLAAALHAMGYRGNVSADAILTADGDLRFTEWNSCITGSTHIYLGIGARVIGSTTDRFVLDMVWREERTAASFAAVLSLLQAHGHGFDPESRTGVILHLGFDPEHHSVRMCFVDRTLAAAEARAEAVDTLLAAIPTSDNAEGTFDTNADACEAQ